MGVGGVEGRGVGIYFEKKNKRGEHLLGIREWIYCTVLTVAHKLAVNK